MDFTYCVNWIVSGLFGLATSRATSATQQVDTSLPPTALTARPTKLVSTRFDTAATNTPPSEPSGDDSATQEREAQAQALADELLKEKVQAGEAKAARKAARKAAKEKAANEQAANAQAANEEPSAPPTAIRLNPRPARRACGSLDSDTNAAMFTLGAECTCVPSPTFDAMCGCAGAEVEGNWGKSHNFWDNKGTISAATYDAPSKCWAYSIKWLDSTEKDSNQRWYFGDKVKCIRARGI
jgi:hypothetical protein